MENTSNTYTNSPTKGLVTDLDSLLISKEYWTHMRNGVHNSHDGRIQLIQNEPSNLFCCKFPYTPIGYVKILNNRWLVFLTDDINSEVGIFDENACTYTKIVNDKGLNFNRNNLIRARFKESFDCSEIVYFTDGGRNPRRRLNITKIPYTFATADDACETKTFTTQLDTNAILMTPNINIPCINTTLGPAGLLRNGAYQFAIAYTLNNQRLTNVYSVTSPLSVFSHENFGRSIELQIEGLDREFDQYELIVIYTQKEVSTVKRIGYFSTSEKSHEITSIDKPEYITLSFEDIITIRPYYYNADDVANNDQYLLWSGVTTRPEINYQLQAMSIKAKWVQYEVPVDFYKKGGNLLGYARDEVYAFGIQWLFSSGEWSSAFHIAGRKAEESDRSLASGSDVYEKASDGIAPKMFEIYDTSNKKKSLKRDPSKDKNTIAEGNMSYWESSELYPDNTLMFGEDACNLIRHHKFPSECTTPRYRVGGDFINILGVRFENIEHPKDVDGNYIKDIVGYRIVRSSREGNRSIIANGIFTNIRSYKETLNQQGTGQEVLYSNYPVNDLRPDSFLSDKQTFYKSGERSFNALKDYKTDQFNFYSPHTLFGNVSLGDQLIVNTEETANVLGSFENVFDHPRAKIISNSVFWLAITVGAIDGVLSVFGKKCVSEIKDGVLNVTSVTTTPPSTSNVTFSAVGLQTIQQCEGLINSLRFKDILKLPPLEAIAKTALKVLQTAAKAGMGVYFAFNTANEILNTVIAFMPYSKYAMQYNSHALFDNFTCVEKDNKRYHIDFYQYLYNGINSVKGVKLNNFKREPSVYLKLNRSIKEPAIQDNTRKTIKEAGVCDNPTTSFNTTGSIYYGSVKRRYTDQYGQIDSIKYLDSGSCAQLLVNTASKGSSDLFYKSDLIFGGDTYISKTSIKRSHSFFSQNIANSNTQDGAEFDYSLYRNVGFPRYWINSEKYEISELLTVGSIPNKLPTNKFNLDCFKNPKGIRSLELRNQTGFFYLFSNSAIEYFVESDYNLDYRDYTTEIPNFYSDSYTNLSELFRSDRIDTPEQFIYDKSYSKELVENSIVQQRIDFDLTSEKCFSYFKNRVIYSLPAFQEQKGDNWLIYLLNNYYDFPMAEFGNITSMQSIDNQQIMFLFDKSGPYTTIGRDELQTDSGVKITIGDAGLFARIPRPLIYTDYYYGNSQSRWAFVNTQFGSFYPSQRQGRIFSWVGQLDEVSREGMHWWFKNYLPSKLLEDFPNFKAKDNPVIGTGLTSGFDNTDEKYYLSKRDYKLRDDAKGLVTYNETKNQFESGGSKVKLTDTTYFEDASWTISYSPKDKSFISWHDWHPDFIIQGETHFMTIKDNTIWKHNMRCDSYCNFYGVDYPWEIEFVINNGQDVQILRSIEYIMEVGKYFNDCRDFHHILDENFDNLIVSNSEQTSGSLGLVLDVKNKMSQKLDYPKLTVDGWKVKYNKEENKYRIQQFFDLTKDRGEFTKNNFPLWTTSSNGYIKTVTPQAINLAKNQFMRKKFRHFQHKIFLSKSISNDRKMIFKLSQTKENISFR